ncbi:uncharacterized protein EV420DRAFT_1639876 [Desarmillaria tabescens]|uniref:Uncharacterized protein n=1 Tax=Armillaria tabescens TaxID=1929756 RepID=A0AA39TKT6_ARMTA|nr:uncharacterized protein EV420DRAFT_1639876 [Desarmillaria tabescens]KAK0462657.1 hypothetical protein EV420DRAFT_1639876 [Desarmillaria tabescens]
MTLTACSSERNVFFNFRSIDMVVPGNLNLDCDDDTWAQYVVAALTEGIFLESCDGSRQEDILTVKKRVKLTDPTRVSTWNKEPGTSKVEHTPSVKPKTSTSTKGTAVVSPSGPFVPVVDGATVCVGVLCIAVAVIDFGEAMGVHDKEVIEREEVLTSQLTDVCTDITSQLLTVLNDVTDRIMAIPTATPANMGQPFVTIVSPPFSIPTPSSGPVVQQAITASLSGPAVLQPAIIAPLPVPAVLTSVIVVPPAITGVYSSQPVASVPQEVGSS